MNEDDPGASPESVLVEQAGRSRKACRVCNRANVSKYKTAVKKLEAAIEEKDAAKAKELLPGVVAIIDRAVSKNALTKNSASRKKSSLSLRVSALG